MWMTKDKSFYKQFFSMYWVLVLNNIISFGVNLADNIMIGSYSEVSLAGVAAVNQIQFIFQQILWGCGDALVIVGSQYWGQKRTKEITKLSFASMLIATISALVLFAGASVAPHYIVSIFSPSAEIIAEGAKYMRIIKYTYVVFAITSILLASLRCVETVRIGFYISLSTLIVNCSINYLLIDGKFGLPELGVYGAATGTLVARCVELVIVLIYVALYDKKLRIRLKEYLHLDKELLKDYLRVARSTVLVAAMFGVSTALQTVILGHMSDNAIAANSVSTSLYQTLKVAAIGASSAASVIIGKTVGRGDMKKIKEYTRTLQVIFLVIASCMSISLFLLRYPILNMYELSEETKRLANAFILFLCITGFGTAYEMPVLTGIVRGGGDAAFILKNDIISIWCIVLPLSFLAAFIFGWPPEVVVFCLNFDQLFKCIPAAIKANNYTWIKKLTR